MTARAVLVRALHHAMRRRRWSRYAVALVGVATLLTVVMPTSGARGRDVHPVDDWCAAANELRPGDELRLAPGDYAGPCTIRAAGARDAPIVIRGADPSARPRLVFPRATDNVLNVEADYVIVRGLAFGPTMPDVDGVRIKAGNDVTVEDCRFDALGGIAVVSNVSSRRITIRGNEIVGSKATAIYLGCHDGASCRVTDASVEGNSIKGVTAPIGQIGYGIQVKLNSAAVIRGNAIVDTKGPGVMVYGARDPNVVSAVEANVIVNSRTAAGIVVGGGAAAVSNNVVVGGQAGIAVEDYGRRGLLRGIVVAHNTVYGGLKGGITVSTSNRLDIKLLYNAAHSVTGPVLPDIRAGLVAVGNVNCRLAPCFVDPLTMNFTPLPGSLLVGRGIPGAGAPSEDLFGAARPPAATAGAVETGTDGRITPGKTPFRGW